MVTARARWLIGAVLLASCSSARHTFPPRPADGSSRWAAVGEPAPPFALRALAGPAQSLSGYAGRVVVVDFWATFCGPCRQELPALEALRARHPEVAILAVSIDDADSDERVAALARELHLGFPVLRDPDGAVAFRYMKFAMAPLTALIGKDGRVRSIHRGYAPPLAVLLEEEVKEALADVPSEESAMGEP